MLLSVNSTMVCQIICGVVVKHFPDIQLCLFCLIVDFLHKGSCKKLYLRQVKNGAPLATGRFIKRNGLKLFIASNMIYDDILLVMDDQFIIKRCSSSLFSSEKRLQHNPSTDLFSKLSLRSGDKPTMLSKGSKENIETSFHLTQKVKPFIFGKKKICSWNDGCINEVGTLFNVSDIKFATKT
ncbi:unnamed protein product [Vicia faba]|uniref:Uncharacterized protein n=1 Tax=Vicia faba TaxID=3906 RepID=A0AAV0ZR80_VICFA|nr:unnamed protein product [Vicia faba]